MTETTEHPEKRKPTLIEIVMVGAVCAVVTIGTLKISSDPWSRALLRYRSDNLEATAALSVENKAVVDAYSKCWMDESQSPSPRCALDAIATARSQGRSEVDVSELIGGMGIFEEGCLRTDHPNLKAVMNNDDLKALMATWCLTHTPKDGQSN